MSGNSFVDFDLLVPDTEGYCFLPCSIEAAISHYFLAVAFAFFFFAGSLMHFLTYFLDVAFVLFFAGSLMHFLTYSLDVAFVLFFP